MAIFRCEQTKDEQEKISNIALELYDVLKKNKVTYSNAWAAIRETQTRLHLCVKEKFDALEATIIE